MILSSTGERVATIYGALFFAFGLYLPFYPVLLANRGMSDAEIAMLIAIPMGLRAVVASPLGLLADWIGSRRRVLMLYAFVAAAAFSLFQVAAGFFALLLVSVVTSLFSNASTPVTDALATSVVRQGGGDYGRMRMWGSMSFVVANIIGGMLIGGYSVDTLFWLLFGSLWMSAFVVSVAPASAQDRKMSRPTASATVIPPGNYLRDRILLAGMASAALIQASHAMVYSFSSLYWGTIGFSGTEIGIFWAIGVIAEILMFFFSGRLFATWGPGQMMVLSGAAATLRWLLFPIFSSVAGVVALQTLHALTFACCHLALMRLVVTRVPDRQAATVQGLYATVGSLTMAGTTLAAGPLYRLFGGQGFQIMSGFAIAGVFLALIFIGIRRQAVFDRA